MEKTRTTLDQWITLQAVVDYGGFAQAAEALHRTQSSISYTISKLEQLLEIKIFSLEKRRAVLTSEGQQLLELSREVTSKAISLEMKAKFLNGNQNNKINIIIDSLYHSDYILDLIGGFTRIRKDYDIDFIRTSMKKSDIYTLSDYDLLITHHNIESLNPIFLEQIEGVLVTSKEHKLQSLNDGNILKVLEKTTYIDLGSMMKTNIKRTQTINVPNVETAIKLTENSFGYSCLPRNLISKELANNTLKELKIINKNIYANFYMYMNKNSVLNDTFKELLSDNKLQHFLNAL
ncbi:LysR family transcriptional regulator [Providencia sneebia]|uniref:LysR family transcriptional regulator n=1 Tax=Providencia sneebia DSM 19967 TaxID=1141660 RepID=K8WMM6_9GAMM|nr:LysR family transcriptional regulator [Providencia sneebia]EKT57390.1 LysR family transcriptional regulator [Providencia sneebia DSM 19967]